MVSRREFVAGMGAVGAIAATPSFAQLAIGKASLTTVSDGNLTLPRSFFFDGLPAEPLADVLAEYSISGEMMEPECNLALYQDGTNTVLFDVGSGPDFMPNAGLIADSLDAVGLTPDDVTHVLFTHAHPDHLWGLLDDFDDPLFTGAQYFMGRKEWDYWWNPETVNTIGDARAAFAAGAKRRMEIIEDNITLFDDGDEVLAGIAAQASYGHTPGHMAFNIQGRAMVVGDAIANNHVAFHYPEWASGSDQIADQGIAARLALLDQLATDKLPVIGFHLPEGGMGRVERAGSAYRFKAEV